MDELRALTDWKDLMCTVGRTDWPLLQWSEKIIEFKPSREEAVTGMKLVDA